MKLKHTALTTSFIALGMLFATSAVQAAATIINPAGTVALGINDAGHLNTTSGSVAVNASATGVAYKFPDGSFRDATAPGCLCEGWGVSAGAVSGSANADDGAPVNLTVDSFVGVNGGTTATSTVHLTSLPGLKVTQAYSPANNAPGVLFKNVVTIFNGTGVNQTNVKYVRVMDWDVPPTEFDEFVTIKGTATTTLLEESGNNGFASADPLVAYSNFDPACHNLDCTDSGPTDHGAYFRFNFGTLAGVDNPLTLDVDERLATFIIFYGAAASEGEALAAIGAESIELFSLGQSNGGQTSGRPATYIFGFSGVGGVPFVSVPEPASLALLGLGLLGMGVLRRRKHA